jgi:hypothetical protein
VNLSIFNNRTTAAAQKRNGLACLALDAGGTYRLERQEWRRNLRSIPAQPAVSVKPAGILSVVASVVASASVPAFAPVATASFCSNLGGSPSIGTPAQGFAFGAFRMHAAPLSLDTSANQQEGDA